MDKHYKSLSKLNKTGDSVYKNSNVNRSCKTFRSNEDQLKEEIHEIDDDIKQLENYLIEEI